MQLQPADGTGRDEASGLGHGGRAARGIDAHERNHDVRIRGGEGEDVVVAQVRTPGQVLVDGKDHARHLARAVVVGEGRGAVSRDVGAEILLCRGVRLSRLRLMLEVHVDVNGDEVICLHGVGSSPVITCGGGSSAYRSSTSDWRRSRIARWLSDPLSVTSPASSDGGSVRMIARPMRVALPVAAGRERGQLRAQVLANARMSDHR